jgi:hypothetical protein
MGGGLLLRNEILTCLVQVTRHLQTGTWHVYVCMCVCLFHTAILSPTNTITYTHTLADAVAVYDLTISLLRASMDPNQEGQFLPYLQGQAQDAWLALVQTAPQPARDDIRTLFRVVWLTQVPITEPEIDTHMQLLESYLLLDGGYLLEAHGKDIVRVMNGLWEMVDGKQLVDHNSLVSIATANAHASLLRVVRLVARCYPERGALLFPDIVRQMLLDCLATSKNDNALSSEDTKNNQYAVSLGGKVRNEKMTSVFLGTVARVMYCSSSADSSASSFLAFLGQCVGEEGVEEALFWLLKAWTGSFANIRLQAEKKLACVCMSTVLPMSAMMLMQGTVPDVLVHVGNTLAAAATVTAPQQEQTLTHTERLNLLDANDPLSHLDLKAFVQGRIRECEEKYAAEMQAGLAQTPPEVLQYLQ